VLTINSGTNIDAFAFYNARVNGQVKETGPTFIQWQGIGQNCVDFLGKSMMSYNQQYDSKASVLMQGYEGYGFAWPMVDHPGQVSFYGAFFAPQNSATDIVMTGQAASAEFESTFGNGPIVTVNTAGDTIKALQDVFTLVREEKVCVLGGDYYWNNTGITTDLKSNIDSKETSCIQAD
jgi:hypothetical protein